MTPARDPSTASGAVDLGSVTAVIVNWETPDLTIRSARAMLDDGFPSERLVIVDNGSDDDSFERLQRAVPGCRLQRIEKNVGYSPAANAAARSLPGSAYLFVNNDAFVERPGSVAALVHALRDPSVGIAVPRILNEDLTLQPTVTSLPTPGVSLVRASGLSRFVPNDRQPDWGTKWDHSSSREIQAASGVVMLFRAAAWYEVGGWDESLYLYAQEINVFFRARRAGWRSWFVADSEFVHLGGGSTGRWLTEQRAWMKATAERQVVLDRQSRVAGPAALASIVGGIAVRLPVLWALRRRAALTDARGALRGFLGLPARAERG